jgi:hypothetical protein
MENSFQTSFIPKKPITPNKVKSNKPKNLFLLIATLLVVISGLAAGGLYFYKVSLLKIQDSRSNSLSIIRNNFEEQTIIELRSFSERMKAAKSILEEHVVLSPLFSLLSEITIPQVQYNSFSHESADKVLTVKLDGVALDYRSIALQADMFNDPRSKFFKNVLFSNLKKDLDGNVKFNLEFDVDPSLLSYQDNSLTMYGGLSETEEIQGNYEQQAQEDLLDNSIEENE